MYIGRKMRPVPVAKNIYVDIESILSSLASERKKAPNWQPEANMFNTPVEIHRRYDLKGSWAWNSACGWDGTGAWRRRKK